MNQSARVVGLPGRRWLPSARIAAAVIAAAGLAVLAAACGGSAGSQVAQLGSTTDENSPSSTRSGGPSNAGGSANSPSAVAYSACMRSHGVRNFPDPTNSGPGGPYFPISKVGISDAASHTEQFIAKLNQCGRLVGQNAPESFG